MTSKKTIFLLGFLFLNIIFFLFNYTEFFLINVLFLINFLILYLILIKHLKSQPNLGISSFIVFNYLFFYLAPIIQINNLVYSNYQFPNSITFDQQLVQTAILSIIVFNIIFSLTYYNLTKNYVANNQNYASSEKFDFFKYYKNSFYVIIILSIIIIPFLSSFFLEGKSMMQAQRTGQYQGSFGKTSTLIVLKFLFYLPFFPAIYSIINKNKLSIYIIIFTIILLIIFKNPFFDKRHALGPIYLLLLTFYYTSIFKSNLKSVTLLFVILVIGYPAVSIITHNPQFRFEYDFTTFYYAGFDEVFLNVFNQLHYDAFANFMGAIKYYQVENVKIGYQLLGSILFFVPRSIWPTKPLSSGEEVGWFLLNDYSLHFVNISQPFIGEGWINFGFIGILIFPIVFAYIFYFFYKWSQDKDKLKNVAYVFFSYHLIYLLRGDLMSGIAFFVGPFLAIYVVPKIISKILNKNKLLN